MESYQLWLEWDCINVSKSTCCLRLFFHHSFPKNTCQLTLPAGGARTTTEGGLWSADC